MQLRLALSLAIVAGGAARADPAKLTISSDGCSPDDVRRQVVTQVGYDPFDDSARRRISIDIRGTTATVALEDAKGALGERTIAGESCAELVASISVVLAMTLSVADAPPFSPEGPPLAAGVFVAGAADLGGVIALDPDGVPLWGRAFSGGVGNGGGVRGESVTIAPNGDVHVVGQFNTATGFGGPAHSLQPARASRRF